MQTSRQQETDALVDVIRRTIRVLGAQPSHASRPDWNSAATRMLAGRLQRAGIAVDQHQGERGTPLLIAGEGPVAVLTYLDDSNPLSLGHTGQPPLLQDGIVRGPGIERKAGVIAAIAPLLVHPELARSITVLIETDRTAGSQTLENWLSERAKGLKAALWEAIDLPLRPPVAIASATGAALLAIRLRSSRQGTEPVYGAVLPDLGVALAGILSSLKTRDQEVRIASFYDNVASPGEVELDTLMATAPAVKRWIQSTGGDGRNLSTAHLTLGLFCAPSIVVRSMSMPDADGYLPSEASAVVELQLMPGQSPQQIIAAIRSHVMSVPFDVEVEELLVRPPVEAPSDGQLPADVPKIPIAPGLSPAALLEDHGISTLGYAVIDRRHDRDTIGLPVDSIANASRFIMHLVKHMHERRVAPS